MPESTPAGICVFSSDLEWKISEKPDPDPESLSIAAVARVCAVIF